MSINWQDIAALGVVFLAVIYVIRRVWRAASRSKRPGCGGSCPMARGCRTRDN